MEDLGRQKKNRLLENALLAMGRSRVLNSKCPKRSRSFGDKITKYFTRASAVERKHRYGRNIKMKIMSLFYLF
jgi:hypothetical protein